MKKTILAATLATGALLSTTSTASAACGIECWLEKTFSANDFVGDWLVDTFGPVHNGGEGTTRSVLKSVKMADKVAAGWKPGSTILEPDYIRALKPSCNLKQLAAAVNNTRSPEGTVKTCFK